MVTKGISDLECDVDLNIAQKHCTTVRNKKAKLNGEIANSEMGENPLRINVTNSVCLTDQSSPLQKLSKHSRGLGNNYVQ